MRTARTESDTATTQTLGPEHCIHRPYRVSEPSFRRLLPALPPYTYTTNLLTAPGGLLDVIRANGDALRIPGERGDREDRFFEEDRDREREGDFHLLTDRLRERLLRFRFIRSCRSRSRR